MKEIIQFAALGIGLGGLYTMAALGLVLIFRCSGVVNFAEGSIGMVGAYVYYEVHVEHGGNVVLAMLLAFASSALVGVTFHLLIMRRMQDASALSKIVATLALLVVMQGLATLRYGIFPKLVPSLLPNGAMKIFGVSVGEDRVFIFAIAVALTAGLWVIYKYTAFGVATSAVAENPRAAAALAISPNKIAAINWGIGSALGALAAVLLVPITSLEPTSVSFLVIPVLAAAVIGRFSSFPITAAAGLSIGVAQALVTRYWHQPGAATAVPFVLVALVLIVRGTSVATKDERFGRMPAVGSGKVSRGPVAFGLIASLVAIWLLLPEDWMVAFQVQIVVAVLLMSLVVVTGYGGQVSLAQGAFAGIGALVTAWLVSSHGWPLALAALAGIAATVPFGVTLGMAGIRTRGVNLAILTLGFGIAIEPVIFANPDYTGGSTGFRASDLTFLGVSIDPGDQPERYATFALVILALIGLMIANLRRGRAGRRLIAVRTNERAAAALGVSVVGAKLYAFVLGGMIAAVGGILGTFSQPILSVRGFGGLSSLFTMQNGVIGGVGVLGGPLVGGGFFPGTIGQEMIGSVFEGNAAVVLTIIAGFGLLIVLTASPDGLAELQRRQVMAVRSRLRQRRSGQRSVSGTAQPDAATVGLPVAVAGVRVPPKSLVVTDLHVRFGGTVALDALSLEVHPGEVVGLIGPNGAGKSTALEAITGFVTYQRGSVELDGVNIDGLSRERRARAGLSRSFQSLELFEDLTVLENLQTACDERDMGAYLTDLVKPGRGHLTDAARVAIEDFSLAGSLDTKVCDLSYAQRRTLAVARAVAGGQSVLLLDEPAAGLDDAQTRRLGETIRRLAADRGIAVVLIEHNVDMVLRTCDRVYALEYGRLIAHGTPAEIRADSHVIEAYLGTSRFRDEANTLTPI